MLNLAPGQDCAPVIQAALNSWAASGKGQLIQLPAGEFAVGSTIIIPASFLSVAGCGLSTVLRPTFESGPVFDVGPGAQYWGIKHMMIRGGVSYAKFADGSEDPKDIVGIRAWNTGAANARFEIDDVCVIGCNVGVKIYGWIGDIRKLYVQRCDTACVFSTINASQIDSLRLEFNRQDLVMDYSNAVNMGSLLIEGDVANARASEIKNCRGITIGSIYTENGTNHPRSEPFLSISDSDSVVIGGSSISGSTGMQDGVEPIEIETSRGVFGIVSIAEGGQRGLVAIKGSQQVDMRQTVAQHTPTPATVPAHNYAPAIGGAVTIRAVPTVDDVEWMTGGQSLKVTCADGEAYNVVQWSVDEAHVRHMRGKRARFGVRMKVRRLPEYEPHTRSLYPSLLIVADGPGGSVQSETLNQVWTTGEWRFGATEADIPADTESITLRVFANQSSNPATSAHHVHIDGISLSDARSLIWQQEALT